MTSSHRTSERSRGYVPPRPEHKQNPLDPQTLWALLRKTVSKWNDDPTLRFGAGLAYYTAFAAVPLVFVVIQLAETILGRETAEGLLLEQLQGLVGEQGAQAVGQLLDTWERAGVVGFATIVELGIMFAALAGAFDQLQDALNYVWGVEPKPQGGMLGRLRRRFLSFLGILGTAFLLLVSLVLTAAYTAGGKALVSSLPGPEIVQKGLTGALSFAIVTLLFALMFKLLPDAKVAWRDVWIGATVSAVLFSVGKWFIFLYLGKTLIISLYGSAAPLVIILLWTFYSCQILLFGAEFTAVYASECGSGVVADQHAVAVGEPAKSDEAVGQPDRRKAG
jgi:membrane protein